MDRIMTKIKNPVLSALSVIILMLAMFAATGFYPFGEKCISYCDMNQQFVPLLLALKDILAGRDGIFLNMANAGGMNFWGVFFFFLSSPFSFLVMFVKKTDMMGFMNVLVTLKMAVAAATSCAFFDRNFKKGAVLNISFGFAYGMCGYAMHYYQNTMWLDILYLLPLLVIATDKLFDEKKPLMYILTLALAVIVNYYIGFMLIIFILLATGARMIFRTGRENRRKAAASFLVSSALAAAISAPVWLPSALQIISSARAGRFPKSLTEALFTWHIETSLPLLYCTPLIFAALPFLRREKATERGRMAYWLSLFILTVIPLFIEPMNKMWQTGSYMSFPYRYGFIPVFCGLVLSHYAIGTFFTPQSDGLGNTRKGTALGIIAAVLASGAFVFIGEYLLKNRGKELFAYTRTIWGDANSFKGLSLWFVVGTAAFASLFLLSKFRKSSKKVFTFFICVMLLVASIFNYRVYMGSVSQNASEFKSVVRLEGKINDNGFYRVKNLEKLFDVNMMGAAGYKSLSHYTSLTSQDYMFALKKLGYSSYWMEVNSNGGTFFTDALLSNNYSVTKAGGDYRGILAGSTEDFDIYRSEIIFPPALFSHCDPAILRDLQDGGRLERQNELYKALFTEDTGIFTEYEPEKDGDTLNYEIEIRSDSALYFDCFDALSNKLTEPINESYSVFVNGKTIASSYPSQMQNGILYLGSYENSDVHVRVKAKKEVTARSFGVYSLDMDRLAEIAEELPGTQIETRGNSVNIAYEAKEDGWLYLPLPYLEGYKLFVNGERTDIYRVLDAFMAIKVSAGENEIFMRFTPPAFTAGFALFIVGAMLTVFYMIMRKRRGNEKSATPIVYFICTVAVVCVAFVTVYVFPVLYYIFA